MISIINYMRMQDIPIANSGLKFLNLYIMKEYAAAPIIIPSDRSVNMSDTRDTSTENSSVRYSSVGPAMERYIPYKITGL